MVEKEYNEDDLLRAWTTLEVLTPQSIPSRRNTESMGRTWIDLSIEPEPWLDPKHAKKKSIKLGNKKKHESDVYWVVYIGSLDQDVAQKFLLEQFNEDNRDKVKYTGGRSALGAIVLDGDGCLVPDKVFISSFPWGYGRVLAGEVNALAGFKAAEERLVDNIRDSVRHFDENEDCIALKQANITEVLDLLINQMGLPNNEVSGPGIAVRIGRFSDKKAAPDPDMLNSFFIDDLAKVMGAIADENVGRALAQYLGVEPRAKKIDVAKDKQALTETLHPSRYPLARWPVPGGHPLLLMQQAAVNHIAKEASVNGMVGVNGPPGTGKTSLLKDVVAMVVLERAEAMAEFDRPATAFTEVVKVNKGTYTRVLYKLDDSLMGHEIVVASSNNKAVENISCDIPAMGEIADFDPPLRYFSSIADQIASSNDKGEAGLCWGLAAAALGNATNVNKFTDRFWWNNKRGFHDYLRIINGSLERCDKDGEEYPVVTNEVPPQDENEAHNRWLEARKQFLASRDAVKRHVERLGRYHQAMVDEPGARTALNNARIRHNSALHTRDTLGREIYDHKRMKTELKDELNDLRLDRDAVMQMKPWFFACWLRLRSYCDWAVRMERKNEAVDVLREKMAQISQLLINLEKDYEVSDKEFDSALMALSKAESKHRELSGLIDEAKEKLGNRFPDLEFWQGGEDVLQRSSPWISDELQRAREALFVQSFALHRAFIDAAARPLRHNLSVLMELMSGGRLDGNKEESTRASLWANLCMVVPVISTTFASVQRFIGGLGRESLGWLLIDEAGQATPQEAVGAIWRARRVVVIGDPLQIEPVVPTPDRLVSSIFSTFNVPHKEWAPPHQSVQTLADDASWLGTRLGGDEDGMWMGSPLRVHFRCQEPMFSISNKVAYGGAMVYATRDSLSPIGDILGPSTWIDVQGQSSGKWCREEGEHLLDMIDRLLIAGISEPDIFVISPFRDVVTGIKSLLKADDRFKSTVVMRDKDWINDRVGTVHTFQGKEAEAVVFVLGAQDQGRSGTRQWAGKTPNILNVAVTRAKRRFYVIGSKSAWSETGVFKELSSGLHRNVEIQV